MKIIDSEKLEKFIRKHADADKAIQKWIQICEAADWKSHSDLKNDFLSFNEKVLVLVVAIAFSSAL